MATPAAVRLYEHKVEVSHGGLARVARQRVRYDQITQVLIRRGILFATLLIESTGGHTVRVESMLESEAQEARDMMQQRMRTAVSASSTPANHGGTASVVAQLRELAELKEAGIITEAEFEATTHLINT